MSATSRSSAGVGGGPGRTRRARSRKTATDGARVGSSVSGSGSGSGASRKVYSGGRPERLAAGGQHRQPRARRQERGDRLARRVEQVLAVVDDQQPGALAEERDAGREDVALDDLQVQRRRQGVRDRGRVGDRGEQQHDRGLAALRDLQRHPGLADAARADDRHPPLRRQQPVQRRDLRLPADEAGGRAGAVGRAGGSAAGDVAFPLGQRGRRVETGLVGQPSPVLPADPQRLGGLPGRGEHAHQQEHRRFAQRVVGVRGGGERDDVARPARVDGTGDQGVGHLAVQLRAARDRDRDRFDVGEVGEHRAAPQPVRLLQHGEGVGRGGAGRREQGPRLREVELVGGEVEPVAVVAGLQPARRRTEVRAQPGDVGVQGLPPGVRHLRRPQGVHQAVHADGPALGEREQREHRAALGPGHLDGRAVDDHPQRPEHLHAQRRPPGPFRPFRPTPGDSMPVSATTAHARSTTPRPSTLVRMTKNRNIDHDTVTAFLGRFVGDLGATGTDRRRRHRRPARPLPRARRRRRDPGTVRRADRMPPALPHRVAARAGRRRLRHLRPRDGRVLAHPRAGLLPRRPERPRPARGVPHRARLPARRTAHHRGVPDRRGRRLARARRRRLRRVRRVLPARLRHRTGAELDPRAGGRRREADGRGAGRRRRLRPRVVVGAARPGLPAQHGRRLATTTRSRSSWPGRRPRRPASRTGSRSRWAPRRPSRAPATTW